MKRRTKIVLGGLTAVVLLAGTAVYSIGVPTVAGHAAALVGPRMAFAAGEHRGWRHGRHRGFTRICSEQRDERLDNAIEFADAFLKLEPAQTQAWNGLTAALRAGSARIGETCETVKAGEWPAEAPEKLALAETITTTGLDILREVRPAFDAFYATLDDKQKAALDGLLDHRGHRR